MGNRNIKQAVKRAIPRQVLEALYFLKYFRNKIGNAKVYEDLLKNKRGIEIGGPSIFFRYFISIYPLVKDLDGVNFSNQTMWEGSIEAGNNYNYYKNRAGFQFISEATDLGMISASSYEFVLSSNCLEHVANPLQAIEEWVRVIAPNGYLLLVLPNKASNFDHRRPTTSFEHIVEDYKTNITEHDLTHLDEILELHDLSMDPPAGDYESFRKRSLDNFSNRGLHHHVFDIAVIKEMFGYFRIDLIQADTIATDFVALGQIRK